ncbi:MAG TPA: SMC-Scp complex subunit ScpB, partial [Ignavibacteria bacterium]|nr:SMC-Scp complex subunit ScpB [Ignavibacteria bacterium]
MSSEIKNIVESVIFASEDEISPKQIKEVLDVFQFKASVADIESHIDDLNKEYHESNRSFKIIKIAGG